MHAETPCFVSKATTFSKRDVFDVVVMGHFISYIFKIDKTAKISYLITKLSISQINTLGMLLCVI
jgi:hypothetical protein